MSTSIRVQTLVFRVDKDSIVSTTGLILVGSCGTSPNASRLRNLLTTIRDTVVANLKLVQEGKTHLKDELKTRTALVSVFHTCKLERMLLARLSATCRSVVVLTSGHRYL